MRMWLVNPKHMCRKHLLGEHVELHMFIGTLKRKKSIQGFIDNNLLQLDQLYSRHEELVQELINRGYNHNSNLQIIDLSYYKDYFYKYINKQQSKLDLFSRCKECNDRTNY